MLEAWEAIGTAAPDVIASFETVLLVCLIVELRKARRATDTLRDAVKAGFLESITAIRELRNILIWEDAYNAAIGDARNTGPGAEAGAEVQQASAD